MMRAQQPSGYSSRAGWFVASLAVFVILIQAKWLHSLHTCAAVATTQDALRAAASPYSALAAVNTTAVPACPPPAAALHVASSSDALSSETHSLADAHALAPPPLAAPVAAHAAVHAPALAAALATSPGLAAAPASDEPSKACVRTPPRVLIVTAEQPLECSTAAAQWLGARAMRNRMQYAQAHGYQLHWCTDNVDPTYPGSIESGMWNKARSSGEQRSKR
jgi:hypothetical protein